jgi:1-phosphofructokinase family hexose kinase
VIVCVAANPSIDRLFEVERLTPGAIHRPLLYAQVAGGKGLNAARAAATLGAEVTVAAILAGHAGRWIAAELDRAGIAGEPVWVDGETRSSLSVADRSGAAGLTEFYERGVDVPAAAWRELAATARRLSAGASWLTVSGSLPPGVDAGGYRDLAPLCPCAADTQAEPPAGARLVKLNAAEAAAATGIDTSSIEGAMAAAERLCPQDGAGAVTRGADGAVLVAAGGAALRGRVDAAGRYPVGSGDSFLAGLVVARERGAGWADALRLALGAAAANAAGPGAAAFSRSDAERLAAAAEIS